MDGDFVDKNKTREELNDEPATSDGDPPRLLIEDPLDIDQTLQDKAVQNNLTIQNVKSIIHHVLKDERVVQMVQKIAEKGNAEDEVIYEPKLTRLRVRKAVSSTAMYNSPNKLNIPSATPSPIKARCPSVPTMPHPLLGLKFPEESSDEEYDPTTENTKDTDMENDGEDDDEEDEGEEGEGNEREEGEGEEDSDGDDNTSGGSTPKPHSSEPSTPIGTDTQNDKDETIIADAAIVEIEQVKRPQFLSTPSKSCSAPLITNTNSSTGSKSDEQLIQDTAVFLASLSGAILSPERPILPHQVTPSVEQTQTANEVDDTDEIAHRTRSKFPLVDKDIDEIEASFIPPDVPQDDSMINTPSTCMDIDEDELHWQEWLADLMNPNPPSTQSRDTEDQDDDTEYNFYADQHEDEGEEYRTDRGVKIPQKEVDELIEEILNPNSGLFNTDISSFNTPSLDDGRDSTDLGAGPINNNQLDPTSAFLLESLGLHLPSNPTPQKSSNSTQLADDSKVGGVIEGGVAQEQSDEGSPYLKNNHLIQLWDQIQQHFQLLLQTFVITRHEPSLVFISQITCQAIEEIINLCNAAKEGNGASIWFVPGIDEGREIITKHDPNNPDSVELIQAVGQPPKLPIQVQDIIMNYGVFWQYPQLLPENGFYALDHPTSSKYFLPSEDGLLALGMDHYGSSAWKLIQQNLLPIKAPRQLNLRVKNLCSSRQKNDNVIKCYKRTGQVVLPFTKDKDEDQEETSKQLPQWIQLYHRKRIDKERVEEKRKERQLEAMVKMVKTAGEVRAQPSLGIKRSLSEQFKRVESTASKKSKKTPSLDLTATATATTQSQTKKKRKNTSDTENTNEYNQLLYLAGLEANDKAARFAYKYLTEVKATVMDSPGVYESFLRLVKKAREKKWRAVKLYIHVCDVLRDWPHLLKLFMAFVGPVDAIEANVLEEKFEFEQIKSFVDSLEKKYCDSPLHLEEILTKMRELSQIEKLTQQKVLSTLGPLIDAHQDLLEDLKCFVQGIRPLHCTPSGKDDFEEINLIDDKQTPAEVDDYEEMYIADTWTPLSYDDESDQPVRTTSEGNNSTVTINDTETTNTEHSNGESRITTTVDQSSPLSHTLRHNTSAVVSTGSTGTTLSQTVTATCTLLSHNEVDTPPVEESVSMATAPPKPWTREDDRYLLETCLQIDRVSENPTTLIDIANHLHRPAKEVHLRCTELLQLMKSMTA